MADGDSRDGHSGETDAKQRAPSPWSVRGVSREARAKASKAAARRRQTLGEWVTTALSRAANEELSSGGPSQAAQSPDETNLPTSIDGQAMNTALAEIAHKLADDQRREKALVALAKKIELVNRQSATIATMSARMTRMERQSTALMALIDRLETADRRERAMLALMHQMAESMQRADQRVGKLGSGVSALRAAFAAENRAREKDSLTTSLEPLESTIKGLIDRLPPAEAQVEPEAPPPPAQPVVSAAEPELPQEAPGSEEGSAETEDTGAKAEAPESEAATEETAGASESARNEPIIERLAERAAEQEAEPDKDDVGEDETPPDGPETGALSETQDEPDGADEPSAPAENEKPHQELIEPETKAAEPPEVEGRAAYDYETLNRHAIENTRRLTGKEPERKKRRGFFGWGRGA